MDDTRIEFPEYTYISLSGYYYSPVFNTQGEYWTLVTSGNIMPFEKIALLCNIPPDDAVMLKLRYGG